MKRIAAAGLLAMASALAQADTVYLAGGGAVQGEIVERRADVVVVEAGPGRVTLPMSRVVRIVSSTSDLGLYHARAAALSPRDVGGWLDLAAWARAHDLATQAREAYGRVLEVDPHNVVAHLALGDVRLGERWVGAAEANRARGLVEFEGAWMTPEERQTRMEERAADAQERQALREAEARAREAEARVREAEARARAAEADARQADQPAGNGIPYPYVFGPGPYVPGPFGPYDPFPPVVVVRHRNPSASPDPVPPPPPPVRSHHTSAWNR